MLTAAGQSVRVHDAVTTAAIRNYRVTSGDGTLAPLRVEGTQDNRHVFAGACWPQPWFTICCAADH